MEGHHVRDTTTIVSGPMCADAADCRLLGGGPVRRASWPPASRPGCGSGSFAGRRGTTATRGARGLRGRASSALRGGDRRRGRRGRDRRARARPDLFDPRRPTEDLAGDEPREARRARRRREPGRQGAAQVPAAAPGGRRRRAPRRVRNLVRRSLARAFERVDVIAWPTVPGAGASARQPHRRAAVRRIHAADYANPRPAGSPTSPAIPAISVPVGLSSDGLPSALQLLAPHGDATSCCWTPPRRWSAPPSAATSRRGPRSPPRLATQLSPLTASRSANRGSIQSARCRRSRPAICSGVFSGGVRAVDGVDLEVAEGEIYAFLGPNGAGKTTTVRMLTTLLQPDRRQRHGRRPRRRRRGRGRARARSASRSRRRRSTR